MSWNGPPTLDYTPEVGLFLSASPRYTDLIARIPGFRYSSVDDVWVAPAKFPIALATRGVLGDALVLTDTAIAWAERRKDDARVSEQIRTGQIRLPSITKNLYPFQEIGTAFITLCERVLLADEMGTGKTVQAAAALRWLEEHGLNAGREFPYPCLVVCTNAMKGQWKAELQKWADIDATIIDGTKPQRLKQFARVGYGKLGTCAIHNAIPNESTTPKTSAETATRRTSAKGTRSTRKDKGQTVDSGPIATSATEGPITTESTMGSPSSRSMNSDLSAPYVTAPNTSTLITTTPQDGYADGSADHATWPSGDSDASTNQMNGSRELRCTCSLVAIINWDGLRGHSRLAGYGSMALKDSERVPGFLNEVEWATVIADEAHKAKDPTAKQTRALWAVSNGATYRWALTGTPIAGKAEDLWSMLRFLDPEAWPVRTKWMERYTLTQLRHARSHEYFETVGYNPHNEGEMNASIRPHFIRRTKAEVLPQLPPKIYRQVWVEMGAKQAKVYQTLTDEMMAKIDSGVLIADNNAVQNVRLGQAASGYLVLEELADESKVAALEMPSCKVDALLDILDESDEPIVVGSESRLLIELCARQLTKAKISYVLITGKVSPEERTANVEAFQTGTVRACLVTLGAGAEGITLTAASKLVFLQRSFSMTANLQFQDRIHRIGQEAESIEIIDVLTTGTTDEDRWEISNDKEGVAQQVYRDPAYIQQRLSRKVSR